MGEQVDRSDGEAVPSGLTFQEVARAHLPRLYRLARHLEGDGAEDLVQECLLRAYRGYGSLHREAAAGAWLTTILVNCHRDRLRKQLRSVQEVSLEGLEEFSLYRQVAEEDPFPYSDSLHTEFLGLFGAEDVHGVLQSLPPIYRTALVLRYIEGFSTKEIARMLESPLGTVLARLHRGRKLFERALWDYAEANGLLEGVAVRKEPEDVEVEAR
ncbi:MAG TPA: sigma-70 family RNA polymerase sigma factor [Actinomycetota bacterium]|nr:sigma-70 family RNA polymerase sigma factor [Actinomycetota bacterium]